MKRLVFIVEDNPAYQKLLQVHFEALSSDYEVRTFADPAEMVKHLHDKPHAIVLDHFFEDKTKTGLDYLTQLRKTHRGIPVIYHTTLNDDKVRNQVMALGAEEYIIKDSASLVRLRTALDSLLKKSQKKGVFGRLFGK